MISVERLSKYYDGKAAIKDVSFNINAGEIVGLLGLNGAGKSTILKILGCFLLPSSGRASISGFSVEDDPNDIRALIGYLPDTPPLYNEMPVGRYLRYVARLKGVSRSQVEPYVRTAMERTNLNDVCAAPIGSLSHGFRQRVGIAQAVVHKPKVLILDEPINGLDPVQIVEMRDLILSLRKEHTVILSSHILSEITKTCDRILIVDHGKLVAETKGGELFGQSVSRVILEVANFPGDLAATIRTFSDCTVKVMADLGNGLKRLEIELRSDLRGEIARKVVEAGGDLITLARQGDELEDLFMRFVRA